MRDAGKPFRKERLAGPLLTGRVNPESQGSIQANNWDAAREVGSGQGLRLQSGRSASPPLPGEEK